MWHVRVLWENEASKSLDRFELGDIFVSLLKAVPARELISE